MKLKRIIIVLAVILAGCGKDPVEIPEPLAPEKAELVFPEQSAVCTDGTIISGTEASVILKWKVAANADSYEVSVKDLLTGIASVQAASTNQLSFNLRRGNPYEWFVVAKSKTTTETSTSDTWRFYMAGLGLTSYSPFPAVAVSPTVGQSLVTGTLSVNLSWLGSDTDNDIAGYDVYFGTGTSPILFKSNITDTFVNNVTVSSGTTYYWQIVTKDAKGNTSTSEKFWFSVK